MTVVAQILFRTNLLLKLLTSSSEAYMMEFKSRVGLDLVESSAMVEIERQLMPTLFRHCFAPSSTDN
jgi:hypothetical protein